MNFEDVKNHIEKVKHTEKFRKLEEFTHMTSINENQDFYENLQYYLKTFHYKKDFSKGLQPDYDYFISFLEHYFKEQQSEIFYDENGRVDLKRTLYIIRPRRFCGEGLCIENGIMFADGSIYYCKRPLNLIIGKCKDGLEKFFLYSGLVASYVARTLQVDSAKISLATPSNNIPNIMSKNVLNENEELISYAEDTEDVIISKQLEILENSLRLRNFPEEEIQKTKFEFLKQEFVAKIIGLRDQKTSNSPIIISVDKQGKKHVKMAPMLDLDACFGIGEGEIFSLTRKCDNGKSDVISLIEQYKKYPGFIDFVKNAIKNFNTEEMFNKIYEETGLVEFENCQDNNIVEIFGNYINKNVRIS